MFISSMYALARKILFEFTCRLCQRPQSFPQPLSSEDEQKHVEACRKVMKSPEYDRTQPV